MKIKVLLTLLIITMITIAIISGCGGGSGTTQPASLVTPTPNMTGNMAYITIKVKWPEQGKAGKLIMSSEDGQEITASTIPYGTKKKDTEIIWTDEPLYGDSISNIETTLTIAVPLPIPALPVKIWAGAFSDLNETDHTKALPQNSVYTILKVGNQTANISSSIQNCSQCNI